MNAVMNILIPQNVGISLLGKMGRYLNVGCTYGTKAFSSILGKWLSEIGFQYVIQVLSPFLQTGRTPVISDCTYTIIGD